MRGAVTLLLTLLWICNVCLADGQAPEKTEYHYPFESGTYSFKLVHLPSAGSEVGVAATFQPRPDSSRSHGNEKDGSAALEKFLVEPERRRLRVEHFYIPTPFETEIVDRIQTAAAASPVWRDRTPGTSHHVLVLLVHESKAYDAWEAVLKKHGLGISSISVEEILLVTLPHSKIPVPKIWTTFLSISAMK